MIAVETNLFDGGFPSREGQDLIERFMVAHNAVEHYLRDELDAAPVIGFSKLVTWYADRNPTWGGGEDLKVFAKLRNVLVHDKMAPHQPLSIPSPAVVERIEQIRDDLLYPRLVSSQFTRRVETVTPRTSLFDVLQRVRECDFSQFPVYDGNEFRGLLTVAGIARWLAQRVKTDRPQIDFDEVLVEDVLPNEEDRGNWAFTSTDATIRRAFNLFREQPLLRAVLITPTGTLESELVGIITSWDVVHSG